MSRIAFGRLREAVLGSLPQTTTIEPSSSKEVLVSNESSRLPSLQIPPSDDQDQDGLNRLLETFYGTDQTVSDTDGDGMNDGEEVLRARNPNGNGSLFGFGLGKNL